MGLSNQNRKTKRAPFLHQVPLICWRKTCYQYLLYKRDREHEHNSGKIVITCSTLTTNFPTQGTTVRAPVETAATRLPPPLGVRGRWPAVVTAHAMRATSLATATTAGRLEIAPCAPAHTVGVGSATPGWFECIATFRSVLMHRAVLAFLSRTVL